MTSRVISITVLILLCLHLSISTESQLNAQNEYYIVDVSPDETKVAAISESNNLHVFDSGSGNLLFSFPTIPSIPLDLAWNPDSTQIATVGGDSLIRLWCADTRPAPACPLGQLIVELTGHRDPIVAIAWGSNNFLVSSGQVEGLNLRLWDMSDYSQLSYSTFGNANEIAWHPDNQELAIVNSSGTYLLSSSLELDPQNDFISEQRLESVEILKQSVAWSPNGTYLASAGAEGEIDVYNYPEATLQMTLPSNGYTIYDVIWSPDSRHIVGNSADGTLRVWNIQTGDTSTLTAPKNLLANLQIDWTISTGLIFPTATEIIGLGLNQTPGANAGANQQVTDLDNDGKEIVSLAGASSVDDVVIVEYSWSVNGIQIATGATPTVDLAVGTHTITLTVTDDDGLTSTDEVVVAVNPSE